MNKSELHLILNSLNIIPKKTKGQNFLIDQNILNKILTFASITSEDIVLEVGPGLGILTEHLVKNAKKVYAIEIDSRFYAYLRNKFEHIENLEIINANILDIDLPDHNKVVSNLPFSATGPILSKLFFKNNPPQGIIIVERDLANRILNKGNYKTFSRITVGVNSFMDPQEKFQISHNCFYPIPKIDVTLLNLAPKQNINPFLLELKKRNYFLKFIAGIMPYKNKNIVNALELFFINNKQSNLNKEEIYSILSQQKVENKKVFSFQIDSLIEVAKILYSRTLLK